MQVVRERDAIAGRTGTSVESLAELGHTRAPVRRALRLRWRRIRPGVRRWAQPVLAVLLVPLALAGLAKVVCAVAAWPASAEVRVLAIIGVTAAGCGALSAVQARQRVVDLQRRNKELSALYHISRSASAGASLDAALSEAADHLMEALRLCAVAISVQCDGVGDGPIRASRGFAGDAPDLSLPLAPPDRAVSVASLSADPSLPGLLQRPDQAETLVTIPVRAGDRVVGRVLAVFGKRQRVSGHSIRALRATADQIGAAVESALDHANLVHLAITDALTGLANRQQFEHLYRREVERARRYREPLSVAMLDVNGFKAINDTLGHVEGDRALAAIGRALRQVRSYDIAARYGGDEFVIVMPRTTHEAALAVVERLKAVVRNAGEEAGLQMPLTVSVGVATTDADYERLLRDADAAMYEDKRATSQCGR